MFREALLTTLTRRSLNAAQANRRSFANLVELALGLGMIFWKQQRVKVGITLALFYVLIFPGNIAQYMHHTNAFGLDTDKARLIRLFFQPVLVLWALWSTGALKYFFQKKTE